MSNKKSAPRPRRTWRDTPDSAHTNRLLRWPSPESLHPTENTMINSIMGDESAQAIIQSYAACIYSCPTEVLA
jgi:hypothetical protein